MSKFGVIYNLFSMKKKKLFKIILIKIKLKSMTGTNLFVLLCKLISLVYKFELGFAFLGEGGACMFFISISNTNYKKWKGLVEYDGRGACPIGCLEGQSYFRMLAHS